MLKTESAFHAAARVAQARHNVATAGWAAAYRDQVVAAARPWLEMDDDALWSLMFGATIRRSWMVWSDGYCPACQQGVTMYHWKIDAMARPWQVVCPHCAEAFPKNDFGAYYGSGLDARGVFDPELADRSLLFNSEHPDPADPLHGFGVDDGEGYTAAGHRWRFIGTYLIYGQWKQAVVSGIRALAAAHVLTGEAAYARKTGILLDRVADLYPEFDFGTQGVIYEGPPLTGYVSTWHDACEEVRELALAYDQVFEALRHDGQLVAFLGAKAATHGMGVKQGWEDIQRNIEERIFRDTLTHRNKIHSNYPRTEIALITLHAVLDWPARRAELDAILDPMLETATAVDGVTGEKGLNGYSAFVIQGMAVLLEQLSWLDAGWLPTLLARHPRLRDTWRFFLDTWCLQTRYPHIGDCGALGAANEAYAGVYFQPLAAAGPGLAPSMFSFLWQWARLTGDEDYVRALYSGNGYRTDGLPHDIFAADAPALQQAVREVIDRSGARIRLTSVDKPEWHLAILRSGTGEHERAVWLDYDAGGAHAHADGMNLGLFAHGHDLMPDLGYPPVQFGGWGSAKSQWYGQTAAHNTVVVDGKNQHPAYQGIVSGRTTLWLPGHSSACQVRAVRADGPELNEGRRYERLLVMVDVAPDAFYLVDIFRVEGGTDHARFAHAGAATLDGAGLRLEPMADYGYGTLMRDFRGDAAPAPGWTAVWSLEADAAIQVRHTDFTAGATAATALGWAASGFAEIEARERWLPRLMVRRQGVAPLSSLFAAVIEPTRGASSIRTMRRLPVQAADGASGDFDVALEITLQDGRRDIVLAVDNAPSAGRMVAAPAVRLESDCGLSFVRLDRDGEVERAALGAGSTLVCGGRQLLADGQAHEYVSKSGLLTAVD